MSERALAISEKSGGRVFSNGDSFFLLRSVVLEGRFDGLYQSCEVFRWG